MRLVIIVLSLLVFLTIGFLRQPPVINSEIPFKIEDTIISHNSTEGSPESKPPEKRVNHPTFSVWTFSTHLAKTIPSYNTPVEGSVLVDIDAEKLRDVTVGSAITFLVPQLDQSFSGTIDNIKTYRKHLKILKGSFDSSSLKYSFLITLGTKNTFANIHTPSGSYELVGNTTQGWLMPSANMDQHVDNTKPDYVLPDNNKIHEEGGV